MRTTLNLDDEILRAVSKYAESRSLSLGKAASDLIRKGLNAKSPVRVVNGVRVFDLPDGSPKVTSKKVRDIESEIG